MDPGLSRRMRATMNSLAPNSPSASRSGDEESAAIDLSTAQNEVIRPELLEFFKSMVEDKITEHVRMSDQPQRRY